MQSARFFVHCFQLSQLQKVSRASKSKEVFLVFLLLCFSTTRSPLLCFTLHLCCCLSAKQTASNLDQTISFTFSILNNKQLVCFKHHNSMLLPFPLDFYWVVTSPNAPKHIVRKYDPDENKFGFIMASSDA